MLVCVWVGVCVWCVVCCCVWCVCGVWCGPDLRGVKIQFVWGGVVWVVRTALSQDRPPAGPPSTGPPKISLCFPVPPQNSFFSSLSGGSSRGILVVFETPGPSNVHVWARTLTPEKPERAIWVRHDLESDHNKKERNTENGLAKFGLAKIWIGPKLAGPKPRWPKMDWPKLVKSGWPKLDWPKSVSSVEGVGFRVLGFF